MGRRERTWGTCARLIVAVLTAIATLAALAALTAIASLTALAGCGSDVGEFVHSQRDTIVGHARHRDAFAKSGLDGYPDAFVQDSIGAPGRGGQAAARRIGRHKPAGRTVGERRGVTRGPRRDGGTNCAWGAVRARKASEKSSGLRPA